MSTNDNAAALTLTDSLSPWVLLDVCTVQFNFPWPQNYRRGPIKDAIKPVGRMKPFSCKRLCKLSTLCFIHITRSMSANLVGSSGLLVRMC
ncbi:hypothetical protein FRX31_025552 [Thalictrum thalictroides]|uniref:Uncharacterized protein n=1 Tax=Thalictrum thalictroides TaxID=46969 RepID=A0A7J6VIW6_THATH|nr:hypothetical protein FRX31_025552 [Thalictrum thalictroides]